LPNNQSGLGAYLLEEELPDVFQCSVGNLTPNQSIKIRITYVTELKQDTDSDQVRFVLPTAIAPRYGGESWRSSWFTTATKLLKGNPMYSSSAKYTLDIKITCRMAASIESPSHKITTKMNVGGDPNVCKVGLVNENAYLTKDFVLIIKIKDVDKPRYGLVYSI
jgi:von Willebrand factor A domain-containing protein 5